jgi:hypothetical protein
MKWAFVGRIQPKAILPFSIQFIIYLNRLIFCKNQNKSNKNKKSAKSSLLNSTQLPLHCKHKTSQILVRFNCQSCRSIFLQSFLQTINRVSSFIQITTSFMNQAKFSSFHSYSKLSATYTPHSLLNNLTPSSSNENITKKCTYETNPIHKNNYLRRKISWVLLAISGNAAIFSSLDES